MARVDIPIPGKDKDYDSRKSRAKLVNLMVDTNSDGSFKSIVKREGTEVEFTTTDTDGIVSNFVFGGKTASGLPSRAVFVAEDNVYTLSASGVDIVAAHGEAYNGSNIRGASINDSPDEFLFGYNTNAIITDGDPLGTSTSITDAVFLANELGTPVSLNGRFYLAQNVSPNNQLFASDLLDGLVYNALAFASADEKNGDIRALAPQKSALYTFSDRHIQYWQTFDDPTFPLRPVQGASIDLGISPSGFAPIKEDLLDILYDNVGFVGSDSKVYLLVGGNLQLISDIDFSHKVDTDNITLHTCSFIDGPNHRYFCVSSINYLVNGPVDNIEEFTWVYDLKTGQSHYRTSPSKAYWNKFHSFYLNERVYLREHLAPGPGPGLTNPIPSPSIHRLSREFFDDSGTDFECLLQTASLSFSNDVSIEFIEIEMETGVGNVDSADPEMTVAYSKDGGVTFTTWGTVKLGGSTDKSKRIRMDNFGRLVRHTDFILQLTIEEPVRVEIYGIYAEVGGGF